MNRVNEREWVFKLIFENQFDYTCNIENILINHELDIDKNSFLYESLEAYSLNKEKISLIIKNEIGDNNYKRLSKIDRSILFLSVNEISNLSIPESVSINEAVNLAKKYSSNESYKFINSVLGSIIKTLKNNE